MHFINPFKGLRPIEDKASSVSIPSTDQLSQEVIVNHKKKNPWSYLNIFNPDLENLKSFVLRLRNAKMIHQLSNFEIPKMSIIFSTDTMYSESCCEEEHVW